MSAPPTPEQLALPARATLDAGEEVVASFLVGGEDALALLPCMELSPHETVQILPSLLSSAKWRAEYGAVRWVAFVSDSYLWSGIGVEADDSDLGELFFLGDPSVTEALAGMCICPDGPTYGFDLPYVRDGAVIEWGQMRTHFDRQYGRVAEGIYALFAQVDNG